ncbi:MAG: 5-amino-6-(D-ribitylamino)uracil--L-tyrosine 4-hydroxyphenyl transferase CofH [Hyphomicrobiaceae bacterium]|nr:5-amino-6-(D-ribitylamino)uracil--L-tyrosine 4-hydroxyphenyl transferase CofH [Hyphomicrobiaceae bacterium]
MTEPRRPRRIMPRTFAVVPMKDLDAAKQRLGAELPPSRRRALVLAMLEDVLATLVRVPTIERTLVVTRDADVAAAAARLGAHVVGEPVAADMNASIAFGLAAAAHEGAERALIVPGDVPLATPTEIEAVLRAAGDAMGAIAPDEAREGTNALLLPLPAPFAPAFGKASFARHRELAASAGLPLVVVERDGLAHDIDLPSDLVRLDGLPRYAALGLGPLAILDREAAHALTSADLASLLARAEASTLAGFGRTVTYSRKVFIPLTQLCRDVCHYCTFAHTPRHGTPAYLSADEVLAIARAGAAAGCKEALFTLGDKPELRYRAAREALAALGFATTLDYLESMAGLVLKETGLLPHINAGIMDEASARRFKAVSASQGLMLETVSDRLSERGGPHFGSPDKRPAVRLEAIEAAGRAGAPFTTGLLIGIGETRAETIDALLAIRGLQDRYGHIQEVIVQNFRAKAGTRMATAPEPSLDEHLWAIAAARLVLGPRMSIQAPPNLHDMSALAALVQAGVNDWGGVSPVTPDHVNPEAPWPHLARLAEATEAAGRTLAERTAIAPLHAREPKRWLAPELIAPVLRRLDGEGLAREDDWAPGDASRTPPQSDLDRIAARAPARSSPIARALDRALAGQRLGEAEIAALFAARGDDFTAVCNAADTMRKARCGDSVSYVVVRNINYTNICTYGCKFCAFSKGRLSANTRDKPYDLDLEEVAERTRQAWARGATEVCLQGGIAPKYTGHTYLAIAEAVKIGAPDIHVHAFSPLEVWHGAGTLQMDLRDYLARLKDQGLSSLPGTAAEILDDEVRRTLCPDKIGTDQWLAVMEAAHAVGLKSTATIMFGHIDGYEHWARHLIRVRDLQERTGGFTELVPLSFVHMESPIYLRGQARKGPTFRESVLMHAIGRLVLDRVIPNIQASWVKLGPEGAAACLSAGANDVGGTLMNESITRAAGAAHGQEMLPMDIETMIRAAGRTPRQRTTFYGDPPPERVATSLADRGTPETMIAAE